MCLFYLNFSVYKQTRYSRLRRSTVTCHVDATAAEPAPYRLVTSSAPFLRCFIGSSDTLDEASSLRGDMGAVYVFEREVSAVICRSFGLTIRMVQTFCMLTESPTARPTVSPTARPTVSPSANPTVSPTARPTVSPSAGTLIIKMCAVMFVFRHFRGSATGWVFASHSVWTSC
jgi:hypothetical protein